eukprot:NODE_297_length_10490_cov_1.102974.p4 type:complete len:285 gc:universal NODE_297_length_10490_cov_1.102974:2606-1752(-)
MFFTLLQACDNHVKLTADGRLLRYLVSVNKTEFSLDIAQKHIRTKTKTVSGSQISIDGSPEKAGTLTFFDQIVGADKAGLICRKFKKVKWVVDGNDCGTQDFKSESGYKTAFFSECKSIPIPADFEKEKLIDLSNDKSKNSDSSKLKKSNDLNMEPETDADSSNHAWIDSKFEETNNASQGLSFSNSKDAPHHNQYHKDDSSGDTDNGFQIRDSNYKDDNTISSPPSDDIPPPPEISETQQNSANYGHEARPIGSNDYGREMNPSYPPYGASRFRTADYGYNNK